MELQTLRLWESGVIALAPRWFASRPLKAPRQPTLTQPRAPPRFPPCFSDCEADRVRLQCQWATDVSSGRRIIFGREDLIGGLQVLAIVDFVDDLPPELEGRRLWFYIDNNNVLDAATNGDSNTDITSILVSRLWPAILK